MTESRQPLPAFEHPPVIETLLGVQFSPLESFTIPNLGLYWAQIRDRYPIHEVKPPLASVSEEFEGGPPTGLQVGLRLAREPEIRCWFIDDSGTQLIQVQKDRFVRNWRKVDQHSVYPHYITLRPRFQTDWEGFCDFLARAHLGIPEVNQCEAAYINHIEIGKGWESYGKVHKVVRFLSPRSADDFLPEVERFQWSASYSMPDKKGRLHADLQPVLSRPYAKEVLQLSLTARGKPGSSSLEDILAWFDAAHEWIVRGFAELTTPEMHKVWGENHER